MQVFERSPERLCTEIVLSDPDQKVMWHWNVQVLSACMPVEAPFAPDQSAAFAPAHDPSIAILF